MRNKGKQKQHSKIMEKLEKLKIKKRIWTGYAIILGLMVFISGVAIITMLNSHARLNQFINGSYAASVALHNCEKEIDSLSGTIMEMGMAQDSEDSYTKKIDNKKAAIQEDISKLQDIYGKDDSKVTALSDKVTAWLTVAENMQTTAKKGNMQDDFGKVQDGNQEAMTAVDDAAQALENVISKQEANAINMSRYSMVIAVAVLVVFIFVALYIALILVKTIAKSIEEPLLKLKDASREMANGNLKVHLTIVGDDEVAAVTQSLQDSVEKLSMYVSEIDHSMGQMADGNFAIDMTQEYVGDFKNIRSSILKFKEKMSDTLKSISESSSQVAVSSDQIASGAQALTEGATDQASSIQQLQAMITNIAEEVDTNVTSAVESNKMAKNVGENVAGSNRQMDEMLLANGRKIADMTSGALKESVEKAQRLAENIEHISDASERQAKAIGQINDGVAQISAVIEENTAMAQQSAASSQEMAGQAQILQEMVKQFTLQED